MLYKGIRAVYLYPGICPHYYLLAYKVRRWFIGVQEQILINARMGNAVHMGFPDNEFVKKELYAPSDARRKRDNDFFKVQNAEDALPEDQNVEEGAMHIALEQFGPGSFIIKVVARKKDAIRMFGLAKSELVRGEFIVNELLESMDARPLDSLLDEVRTAATESMENEHGGWRTWRNWLREEGIDIYDANGSFAGTDIRTVNSISGHMNDWQYENYRDDSTFWMIAGWFYELAFFLLKHDRALLLKKYYEATLAGKRFKLSICFKHFQTDFKFLESVQEAKA